jgi:hypothetical protein
MPIPSADCENGNTLSYPGKNQMDTETSHAIPVTGANGSHAGVLPLLPSGKHLDWDERLVIL